MLFASFIHDQEYLLTTIRLLTLFLFMVSELSGMQQVITTLTGINGLVVVIIEVVVTAIYTFLGGFKVSFITDNLQGLMVLILIIIGTIAIGSTTHIDRSTIHDSGLLDSSLLGWQLVYVLPVAVATNDLFLSSFWMRTFASRTDRDLRVGASIACIVVLCLLVLIGVTGLLAVWVGIYPGNPPADTSVAFFLLVGQLPSWVLGFILVLVVALSTAAFDSLVSGMVSTASNDFFRNKLKLRYIRVLVVIVCVPIVVIAVKTPSVLRIMLISDLLAAAVIPVLVLGLWDRMYWWSGFEVIVGGLGGILSVFIFGTIYFGSAKEGGNLLILSNGLYVNDWSVFGAFAVAPGGGYIFAILALSCRVTFQYLLAKYRKERFTAFDRPAFAEEDHYVGQPRRRPSVEWSNNDSGSVKSDVTVGSRPAAPEEDSVIEAEDTPWWKLW